MLPRVYREVQFATGCFTSKRKVPIHIFLHSSLALPTHVVQLHKGLYLKQPVILTLLLGEIGTTTDTNSFAWGDRDCYLMDKMQSGGCVITHLLPMFYAFYIGL